MTRSWCVCMGNHASAVCPRYDRAGLPFQQKREHREGRPRCACMCCPCCCRLLGLVCAAGGTLVVDCLCTAMCGSETRASQ